MTESPHGRYRARLAMLGSDQALLELLGRAGAECGWHQVSDWHRSYGRFAPRDPYATLVLESGTAPQVIAVVEVFERRPDASPREKVFPVPSLGWVRIGSFADDPALPTLGLVLRERTAPSVARYRPRRRCTIRFGSGRRARFAKVFADDDGERIHAAGIDLWQAGARGELDFRVARPDHWDPRTRTLWQHAVPGRPLLDQLLGDGGPALARRIGAAAGSLTRARLGCSERFDAEAQMQRSQRAADSLSRLVPALEPGAEQLLRRLAGRHAATRPKALRPIHGAPHPTQWLDDGERLGLVDFDRTSVGDPELDVATFLAELEVEADRTAGMERLTSELVGGYQSVAGPLDVDLLWTYRAHKRLAKAARSARALLPDGDARAARHLALAAEGL